MSTLRSIDLMIGDWVLVDNSPIQVKQVYQYGIISDLGEGDEEIECFKPIPLTPEILEKNEFVKQEDGYFRYFKPYDENYYIGFESISYLFDGKNAKITKEHSQSGLQEKVEFTCEYLHELQHALRLCGIEKTIEP